MSSSDELREKLEVVWRDVQPLIQSRMQTIAHLQEALENGSFTESLRQDAIKAAHSLAGSLGVFGLIDESKFASEIECLLSGDAALNHTVAAELKHRLELLQRGVTAR